MIRQFKKAVCVVIAAFLTLSITACGGNQSTNANGNSAQGSLTGYEEYEIGADAGILSPATAKMDSNGNLVVYDRGQKSPVYVYLDKDGKRVGELKCDFEGDGSTFTLGPDGTTYIVAMMGDRMQGSASYKYLIYDKSGKKIAETDLGSVDMQMMKGPSVGYSSIAVDKDGNSYIVNSQNGITVYGKDGAKIKDLDVKDCYSLDFDKDGNLAACIFALAGDFKLSVEKLNPSTGKTIWKQDVTSRPRNITPSFGHIACSKTDGSVYMMGSDQISKFDGPSNKQDIALSFMDYSIMASGYEVCDFVTTQTGGFYVITSAQGPKGGKLVVGKGPAGAMSGGGNKEVGAPVTAGSTSGNSSSGGTASAGNVTDSAGNTPADEPASTDYAIYRYDPGTGQSAKAKTVINLTISREDRYINMAISKFQKTNPDYKIVTTYFEDQSGSDMDKVLKNLNTSILSGKGPDIFAVNDLPFLKYAEKNILVDLDQLIKADKSFDMSKYYSNIIDAVRTNGSLYAMPISCSFSVMMANKSILDQNHITVDDTKWTWNDFKAIADKINQTGGGIKALPQMNYNDLLNTVMQGNYPKFIDPVKKTNSFNSQEFYDILNMVKSFGDTNSQTKGGKGMLTDEAVNRGAVAFLPEIIGDYMFYSLISSMANGKMQMLNYPSDSASRGIYSFSCSRDRIFSINKNSKYKEQAWEFIKLLMSDEMQSSMDLNGLAVNKLALEANAKQAIQMSTGGKIMANINGVELHPKPLTQEDIDSVNSFVGKLNTFANYDVQVVDIALDELKSFFEGDKPVQEVCKQIQDRVNTYLGE